MVNRRDRGFTLIELLVVIAIIAILAAMLFPVFARARESARKIQCLSNVKNIAMGIQVYLTDYDRFPPSEHRQEVIDFFSTQPGAGSTNECRVGESGERVSWMALLANPYIRWPVVLDEYIRNRDVWRCPSSKVDAAASFILPGPDWLGYLKATVGNWGDTAGLGPCYHMTYPPGWGGSVTDSIRQQQNAGYGSRYGSLSGSAGTFVQGLSSGEENFEDMKVSTISNASATPVVSDGGVSPSWLSIGTMAYPDVCCAECSGILGLSWYGDTGCPSGDYCDADCYSLHATYAFASDPNVRRQSARHLGGVNVGFADGHAQWYASQSLVAASDGRQLEKVGWLCPAYTSAQGYAANCGAPPAGIVFLYNTSIGWSGP